MDAGHFDRLTRTLSHGLTRRTLSSLLGSLTVGGPLTLLHLAEADAKGKKKRKRKRRRKNTTTGCLPTPGTTSPELQ